jgi:serine protease AprX
MELKGICSFLAVAMIAISAGNHANAGTVLRFQNGNVNTSSASRAFLPTEVDSSAKDFVVQFKSAITESEKEALKAAGGEIFRYVPDDALIVRISSEALRSMMEAGKINGFIPFQGAMKVAQDLPTPSVFSQGKRVSLYISTFTATDAVEIASYIQDQDKSSEILDVALQGVAANVDQSMIFALSILRGVEFIDSIVPMNTMNMALDTSEEDASKAAGNVDDLTGFESGTKVMGFESVWAQGFTGSGQIGAMADTGLDMGDINLNAVDFKGAIPKGYSFGIGARSWNDPMGHGTHVAGSVVSRGLASNGKLMGGAHGATLIPQGMWSPILDNLTVPPKLAKLFDGAYADGARVHTNSWGGVKFGAYDSLAQQVDEFMWDHPDFLVLFAAGNSGVDKNADGRIDPNSVGSPGTAKNVLTVGASENLLAIGGNQKFIHELRNADVNWPAEPIRSSKLSDNIEGVAVFSSRGPTSDGRLKPEIVAPGTNILSNKSHVPNAEVMWGAFNNDYVFAGGTSMATPLTAGAALVTRQILVEKFKVANPSAALVKATLIHSAKDMFPGQYGGGATQEFNKTRPNMDEGYGRVDMQAVSQLSADNTQFLDLDGVAAGEVYSQDVTVVSGKLLANLVYTDAPGTPAAAATLVNNLDLTVVGPDGKTYGTPDSINNNEVVELSGLVNGVYKVQVTGSQVPMGKLGKQPFALVIGVQ